VRVERPSSKKATDFEFRVSGSGIKFQGLGFIARGPELRVECTCVTHAE